MSNNIEHTFPMKRERQPKVIVFAEPGKNTQIINKNSTNHHKRKYMGTGSKEELEFLNIAREVKEFGVTGFTKKIQKKDKQKYAEYLGAHKQKNEKVPYPMLMDRIKKRKVKEEKEKELERAMGIFKKKKKEDKEKITQKLNLGRWVDKSNLIGTNRKDTNINVTKGEIEKLKRSK